MKNSSQPHFQYVLSLFGETDPIRIFEFGYHETPSLHTFGPAVRPYYLLHLVEKGKGYIERNGIKTTLSAGDAFLIVPEEITLYGADEHDPWTYSWIAFNGSYAQTLVQKTTNSLCMKYQKSGLLALKTAFQNKLNDYMGCLNAFFDILNAIKTITPTPTDTDCVAAALHYLENNYFQKLDVQTIAKKFGVSRAYFSTLFYKRTGETPHAYLTKIRIEKAKAYLANSKYSVEEIAYSVGFASLQRFSESFKSRVGVPPSQYRRVVTV